MAKKSILQYGASLLTTATCALSVNAAPAPPGVEKVLNQLPAAVQKTIRAQAVEGRLRAIDRDETAGHVSYDVEMVRQGRVRSFNVGEDGELLDTEVFLNELPMPVRRTIRKKVDGGTLGEIDQSVDSDGASYDVEMIGGGTNRNFTVDSSGKMTDEEVFISELPQDLQASIKKEAGAGTIDDMTRSFDDDGTTYDVDVVTSGKTRTLTFDTKGALVSQQEDVALSSVTEAAQKQIQTWLAGGKLVAVSKVTENGSVSFDVDVRREGTLKSYTVAADGKVGAADGK